MHVTAKTLREACAKCRSTERYLSDGRCVGCAAIKNRKWRIENAEKNKASVRNWIAKNKQKVQGTAKKWKTENQDRTAIVTKIWKAGNSDKVKAQKQRSYQKDPEAAIAKVRAWRVNNPEKASALQKVVRDRRRARQKNAEGTYTAEEWLQLKNTYQNRCIACGIREAELIESNRRLTPDHIVPLAKGGTNYISNIQPLCLPCNLKNWANFLKNGKQMDYRIIGEQQ